MPILLPFDVIQRFASVFDFIYFCHICLGIQILYLFFFLLVSCFWPSSKYCTNILRAKYGVLNFGERWIHTNHLTKMVYFTIYRNMSVSVCTLYIQCVFTVLSLCSICKRDVEKKIKRRTVFFVYFLLAHTLCDCHCIFHHISADGCLVGCRWRQWVWMWICLYVDCGKTATLYTYKFVSVR